MKSKHTLKELLAVLTMYGAIKHNRCTDLKALKMQNCMLTFIPQPALYSHSFNYFLINIRRIKSVHNKSIKFYPYSNDPLQQTVKEVLCVLEGLNEKG